jgi:flagellar FliL protein
MAKKKKSVETDEDGAAPPKGKKKKLIVVAVLLLALGGGGYTFLGKGSATANAEPAPTPGKVVPLEAIHVNLAGGHYLKVGMALQATADAAEPPDGSKALDIAIDTFSGRSLAELNDVKARDKIKHELVEKVDEAYEHEVMDIYFTEFVTQ